MQLRVGADLAIAQKAVRPDTHTVTEADLPAHDDVDVDEDIATHRNRAADIDPGRIGQRCTRKHELGRTLGSQRGLELGQLNLVVGTEHFGLARGGDRVNPGTASRCGDDDVGEVVLALCVIVLECRKPCAKEPGRSSHDARVHFLDGSLLGVRVLLFDDARDVARIVANDAPVTRGVREHHRRQRE